MTSGIGRRRDSARDEGGEAYRERRREIVRAAAEVFKRQGYRATNLADIARAAGTDRATLYYYAAGKAELFDEVVSGPVEANTERAEAIRAGADPAPEKLRRLFVELMASYAEHYPLLYVFVQENLSHVEPERAEWAQRMRRLNRRYEDAVVGVVRDGVDEGTLSVRGDPRIVAYGLLGMLAWTNRWYRPGSSDTDARTIAGSFADTVLLGLAPGSVTTTVDDVPVEP